MKTALVVDDSKYFRNVIKDFLEEFNFKVYEAENGLVAYNLYKELDIDLVTMDINMPVLDGFQAIKKILDYDNKAKIVICSSMMFLDIYIAEGLEAGAKACINKPFTKNELMNAVNTALMGEI